MSDLITLALAFGGGLICGWVLLPEPKFIRDFFVQLGWAKAK